MNEGTLVNHVEFYEAADKMKWAADMLEMWADYCHVAGIEVAEEDLS